MPRPRKTDLTSAEKLESDKIAKHFETIVLPKNGEKRGPEQNEVILHAARAYYQERLKARASAPKAELKDKEKYPPVKPYHFPTYTAFAAFQYVAAEDSAATWKKRFETGKAAGALASSAIIKKFETLKKKVAEMADQMKALGLPFDEDALIKALSGGAADKAAMEAHENGGPAAADMPDEST